MSILFGHPCGNPNSHHAALAHFEAGRLDAFCVPWMPTTAQLNFFRHLPKLKKFADRLERRSFTPLLSAPLVQGRFGEYVRMLKRARGGAWADERLSYEANDWLMRTMKQECRRSNVTAVHAYEDCSLWQFEEAARRGKARIYDMPIGYYPAWKNIQADLGRRYADWLPAGGLSSDRHVRPEQKEREMELADLVLAPSRFVQQTIRQFTDKKVALAPYGVDLDYWRPAPPDLSSPPSASLNFVFTGQISVRKGVPLLLEAWRDANLKNATLHLIGSWQLAEEKKRELAPEILFHGPVSRPALLRHFHSADVFVLPTFFEGRALVVAEALASGLPVLTTPASGTDDLVDDSCGRLVQPGNLDQLVEALRWFAQNQNRLSEMKKAARARAETCTWENYRRHVCAAVATLA